MKTDDPIDVLAHASEELRRANERHKDAKARMETAEKVLKAAREEEEWNAGNVERCRARVKTAASKIA